MEIIVEGPKSMQIELANKVKECMEKAGDVFCKVVKLKADPVKTQYWEH